MPFIKDLLQGAAQQGTQGIIGAGMGLLLEGHNDRRQLKQQEKLQALQMAGNKEMTDYGYNKQLQMWKDTNYSAQVEELKKAGLNPALLYGMGGGGGTTIGSGTGGVSGAAAPSGGREVIDATGMGMQLALLKAQKENIEADTKVKLSTAPNLDQDTKNKEVQEKLLNIEQKFKDETYKANVARNHYETNIAMHNAAIQYEAEFRAINTSTLYTQQVEVDLEKSRQEVANLILSGIKTEQDTKLTQQQIEQIKQNIQTQIKQLQQGDRSLDQKDQDILIDKARNELIEKGIWIGAASNIAGDLIKIWTGGKSGMPKKK